MIFQNAQDILTEVEARMISFSKTGRPSVKPLWRETVGPFKFIFHGLKEFVRFGAKYYCWQLSMMVLCALAWNLLPTGARVFVTPFLILSFLIAPLFFTVFSVPSTYAHSGITAEDVESARMAIRLKGISNTAALEALKANVELLEQPVKKRVSRLQLIVTALWSFWGYWLWNLMLPQSGSALMLGGFAEFVVYSGMLSIIFLTVQGYAKAQCKLFSTIYIAINEQRVSDQKAQQAFQIDSEEAA